MLQLSMMVCFLLPQVSWQSSGAYKDAYKHDTKNKCYMADLLSAFYLDKGTNYWQKQYFFYIYC